MNSPKYYKVCPQCRHLALPQATFCATCGKRYRKGLYRLLVRRVRPQLLAEAQARAQTEAQEDVQPTAPEAWVQDETATEATIAPITVVFVLALLPLALMAANAPSEAGARFAVGGFIALSVGLLIYTSRFAQGWLKKRDKR